MVEAQRLGEWYRERGKHLVGEGERLVVSHEGGLKHCEVDMLGWVRFRISPISDTSPAGKV